MEKTSKSKSISISKIKINEPKIARFKKYIILFALKLNFNVGQF